jgi:glycolate oxidase iron-sulfur subunit
MPVSPTSSPPAPFPLGDADLCVKCGLCLPHCPTYLQSQNEADSPRGRIALMQGLASGIIPPGPTLEAHLDGCLSCRACEAVCPAKVPYGRLMDAGRELLQRKNPQRGGPTRFIGYWLTRPAARNLAARLLWLYQRLGLQWLLRRSGLLGRGRLARLDSLLPRIHLPSSMRSPETGAAVEVSLFTGCMGELADHQTLSDALSVLARLGIATSVPSTQGCCGALHQHAGMRKQAAQLAHKNLAAFGGDSVILSSASGCGATLMEYPELLGQNGGAFSGRVQDLSSFLLSRWPRDLPLKPLKARIAIHTPCTLKNVMKQADAVHALLQKIPGVTLMTLDAGERCCGAAGSYFITQPEMADRLLEEKLEAARRLAPDLIVSGNIGCSLHLAAGLRRAGLSVELLHPVSLMKRQLD